MKKLKTILKQLDEQSELMMLARGTQKVIDLETAKKIVSDVLKPKLEITKMLTVSTAHVLQDTFEALSLDAVRNDILLPVYNKMTADNGGSFGVYVYLDSDLIDWKRIPKDLAPLIRLAQENNCGVICLDSDGPILDGLSVYNWEDFDLD